MDDSDETLNWLQFFKQHKLPSEQLRRNTSVKKPFIYDQPNNLLEREISLRLTAIRETFEEVGICFCSPWTEVNDETNNSAFSSIYHTKDFDIPLWQHKIHNSHESMLNFCDKHKLVPNILHLTEWSVWLTPTFYPKRFETAFFLVALNSMYESKSKQFQSII